MAYLLDADVFIRAKNLHYGMDFCPAFWDWIVAAHDQRKVFSVEKVGDEIAAGDDELADWAAERGPEFFLRPDEKVFPALRRVSDWAAGHGYTAAAQDTFLRGADYYLVSQALAGGHTVVTHEVPAATARRIKIPDACIGLGVKCMSPFEMLRLEGSRFVLGRGGSS